MSARDATYAVWAVLGAAVVVLAALALARRGGVARPGPAVAALTAHRWLRVLLVLAWMWAGWHFFAR